MSIQINYSEGLEEEIQNIIHQGFQEHSIKEAGTDGEIRPYAFIAKEQDKFMGAVAGKLFYGSLHIKELFVTDAARATGLGKKLMLQAMDYGKEQGCKFAAIETMNFQALDFYKKLGFEVELEREGYLKDCKFYYMRKDL